MPLPRKLLANFDEEKFYHVICKSIDGRKLFLHAENRRYFLQRFHQFTNGFIETYAWTLLGNHAHFLIRTLSASEIIRHLKKLPAANLTLTHKRFLANQCDFHELIEQQFNRFFIAYTLSFNKMHQVSGHLFNRPFRRIELADEAHITQLYVYIHSNVMKHGVMKDFREYKWSSYLSILSNNPTHIMRSKALDWFGGKEQFIKLHATMSQYYYNHEFSGED
ncbi:MAG: hypothetical protein WAT19_09105 [Ferruginibacter sp.]